jgi:hypothetical protein
MEGHEVNELQKLTNRAAEDEDKSKSYISVKLNVMSVAFHNIECSRLPPDSGTGDKHDAVTSDDTQYKWVPFPCGTFVEICIDAFFVLGQDRTKKFLDIGCGIGTKVMLADVLFDAHGFDINEEYLNLANQIGCKRTFIQDAMSYEGYDEYDFLYFYRPFKDDTLEREFEERVYQKMKSGALLAPMHSVVNWRELSGMNRVGERLFQKE